MWRAAGMAEAVRPSAKPSVFAQATLLGIGVAIGVIGTLAVQHVLAKQPPSVEDEPDWLKLAEEDLRVSTPRTPRPSTTAVAEVPEVPSSLCSICGVMIMHHGAFTNSQQCPECTVVAARPK
jgi:hypothetical protein